MSENEKIIKRLNDIMEIELSGMTRYLHYSFMITGPNRIPIVKWLRDQALESFNHSTIVGEKITALGGHPTVKVRAMPETNKHGVMDILRESLEFEKENEAALRELLPLCEKNIGLFEMVRQLICEEQEHIEEVEKMLKT